MQTDQHYWQWILTGILSPSESKCDWLTQKNISVSPSLCPPTPMPFFCLQRSRYHGLLSFPLERNMVAGVILTLYARHTEEFRWLGEELEHSPGRCRLLLRLEDRAQNLALLFAQYHEVRGCVVADGNEGQGHAAEWRARIPARNGCLHTHTVSHRSKKLILGGTSAIYRKGFSTSCTQTFPPFAHIHKLFHFLHTYTDFSTLFFLL